MNVVFHNFQKWFAARRVKLHKGARFYQPVPPQGPLQTTLMLGGLVVGLALAGYGYYVLTYIA